jgi:hypothetical protein
MLVHTVLFWLRKDLDGDQLTHFRMGLESLSRIECSEITYIGSPSETPDRPVIDTSYDFCLTVVLKNVAAHDAYQIHPRHLEFLETFSTYWEKVKIYDAD